MVRSVTGMERLLNLICIAYKRDYVNKKHYERISERKNKMDEMWIGFTAWGVAGILMIGIGIWALFSKKPVNFWANTSVSEINNPKQYNYAVAKLFCLYGIIFIILGIPLLAGQNSAWILLSVIGVMIESIMAMIIYVLVIEKKYKKKHRF
jgi:hypothetical protein